MERWNAELATATDRSSPPPWRQPFAPAVHGYDCFVPDFPIMALRGALVCESMCRGGGPAPQLLGLKGVPLIIASGRRR